MHLLIFSLCAAATVLIVLDATPCSMDKRKEMLIKVCGGHYRRKRGSAFNEDFDYNGKGTSKHRSGNKNDLQFGSSHKDHTYNSGKGTSKHGSVNQNDLQLGEPHHHRHDHIMHVIANDTTGGILIRRKRGSSEDFMYCCLDLGNCTFIC